MSDYSKLLDRLTEKYKEELATCKFQHLNMYFIAYNGAGSNEVAVTYTGRPDLPQHVVDNIMNELKILAANGPVDY